MAMVNGNSSIAYCNYCITAILLLGWVVGAWLDWTGLTQVGTKAIADRKVKSLQNSTTGSNCRGCYAPWRIAHDNWVSVLVKLPGKKVQAHAAHADDEINL